MLNTAQYKHKAHDVIRHERGPVALGKECWMVSRSRSKVIPTTEHIHVHSEQRDWVAGICNDSTSNLPVLIYINGYLAMHLDPGQSTNVPVYRPDSSTAAELMIKVDGENPGRSTGILKT